MDYAVPTILFALGFAAALFASGVWRWSLRVRKGDGLPAKDGAVRLDMVGKGRRKAGGPQTTAAPLPSADAAVIEAGNARKARPRGRR